MRKLTLLLSLLLSVGLAAQEGPTFEAISSLNNFENGWYQIQTQTGLQGNWNGTNYPDLSGKYASCVSLFNSPNTWIFTLEESNANLTTLVYIDKDENNNYHIKSSTGRYANCNTTESTSAGNLSLSIVETDNDPELIKIIGVQNANTNYTWGGWALDGDVSKAIIGSASSGLNSADWRFKISSAKQYLTDNNIVAYTVNITGAPEGTTPTVTYMKEGYTGVSTVYDGGTFFAENISKGEITADGVTDRYIYSVNINEGNSTITVNFSINYEKLISELVAEIAKFGNKVGYPVTEVPNELTTASNTAQEDPTEDNYNALLSTLNSVWENIGMENIKMPEDGKVYKITSIKPDGTPRYLYIDGTSIKWQEEAVTDESGYFVCQGTANGFKLAAANGSGLFSDVAGIVNNINSGIEFRSDWKKANALGSIMLVMEYTNDGNKYRTFSTEATNNGMGYYSRKESAGIYSTNNSNVATDFMFEEVSDYTFPATVALGSNGNNYGTLNLPYAVTIPAGVTVNGVEANSENANELNVTPLTSLEEGGVLPAGTPVLLKADNADTYTFAPAAARGTSAIETGLQGTLAATAVTGPAYILAHTDAEGSEIKFFLLDANAPTVNANKAYYVPQAGTNAQALSLHFGTTTGLAEAAPTPDAPTAVYDLSGRQVGKATRGLYIVGGRKVLVK